MHGYASQTYREHDILESDPIRLVELLYRGAIDAIGRARKHVRHGDIKARSNQITRASEIVAELALNLNHDKGGEIARNLAGLYDYILDRLREANFEQREEPLAECASLLATVLDAWEKCAPAAQPVYWNPNGAVSHAVPPA